MSDPYGSDPRMPPPSPADPSQVIEFLRRIPRHLWPNITGLATGESPPPLAALPAAPGKVPSVDDPRVPAALAEGTNTVANVAPLAVPLGGAASFAARGVEALAPRVGAFAARGGYRMPGPALPALASTLASSEAEAAPRLTREQQRQMELTRQQEELRATAAERAARAKAEIETGAARQQALDAAEAERQKAESAARIRVEEQRSSAAAARENEAVLANRPFREKYPSLSAAASNSGLALAALLPYGTRLWQSGKQVAFISAWESAVGKAEAALARGEVDRARLLVNKLDGFRKQAAAMEKGKAGAGQDIGTLAGSTVLPVETSMLPEQIDYMGGNPALKEEAKAKMLDPVRGVGALGGLTAGIIGRHPGLPVPGQTRVSPQAASEAAVKTFKEMVRSQAAQKAAATRAAGKAPSVVPFSMAPGE